MSWCIFTPPPDAALHDEMMRSLNDDGKIPDFAVIVESGYGDPTPDVKAKMKKDYDFDHDLHEFGRSDDHEPEESEVEPVP